ncbi:MAG: translocation/assembly module TamB [Gemmatimonadota bacterium]|nr:translocation/assembly module TamB [Gemmatimonadota bacterium]
MSPEEMDPVIEPAGAAEVETSEGMEERSRRVRRRRRRVVSILAVTAVLASGVVMLVTRTSAGQRLLLDRALEMASGLFQGELSVESIRSPGILSGALLLGVRLTAGDGSTFLTADSVEISYSILSFIRGAPRLHGITFHRPHVIVSRMPGDDALNVTRLLRPRTQPLDSAGVVVEVDLGFVRVVEGLVEVLTPAGDSLGPRIPTVEMPGGGGTLRRVGVESLWMDVTGAVLRLGSPDPFAGVLSSSSFGVSVLDRPVIVDDLAGNLSFGVDGISVVGASARLPNSVVDGVLRIGPHDATGGAWTFHADLDTQGADLRDLHWLDERVPAGVARGGLVVSAGREVDLAFRRLVLELSASSIELDGGVVLSDEVIYQDLDITASPLSLRQVEPWLPVDLDLDDAGWLSGTVHLSGRPRRLETSGRVTVVPLAWDRRPSTADFGGVLHFAPEFGASEFSVRVDPANFGLLRLIEPRIEWSGQGRTELELDGSASTGVRVTAGVEQMDGSWGNASVKIEGVTSRDPSVGWMLDLRAVLTSIPMGSFLGSRPYLRSDVVVSGTVHATGSPSELRIESELRSSTGTAAVTAAGDLTRPGRSYALQADLWDFPLGDVLTLVPASSRVSGRVEVEGEGWRPDSLRLKGSMALGGSEIGGVAVDSVAVTLSVSDGLLQVDTVTGVVGGTRVHGAGSLGLIAGRAGQARLDVRSDDVRGLRPFLMTGPLLARDDPSMQVLDWELLQLDGVLRDTLPSMAEIAMSGSVAADVRMSGDVTDLDLDLSASITEGRYRTQRLDTAYVTLEARHLGTAAQEVTVDTDVSGLYWSHWSMHSGSLEFVAREGSGEGALTITRAPGEVYMARGAMALDSLGGHIRLDDASMQFDSVVWSLVRPTEADWRDRSLTVPGFELRRPGTSDMAIRASGVLSTEDASDFLLEVEDVQLQRLARLLQREESHLSGNLDARVEVKGPASLPVIQASLDVAEPRFQDLALTRVRAVVGYQDRDADVRVEAWNGGNQVLTVAGSIPVDLALSPTEDRIVDAEMDVRVSTYDLPAALPLSYMPILEDVSGAVSGEFRVRGRLDDPRPSGALVIREGAWTMEALGVRHQGVEGSLELHPDRTVDVSLSTRSTGVSEITGRVILDPLSDPGLDLAASFRRFHAVGRADVVGYVSGDVTLTGRYRSPTVRGSLVVDEGVLFLDEFVRSVEIVDLTDPRLLDDLARDEGALGTSRRFLEAQVNPFLQSLKVNIDLSVPRDTWLRSREMNVEMGGDLIVAYDREVRDMVLVGSLAALRGSYTFLGRRFQVEDGSVSFIGIPGINPSLDIRATTQIRSAERDDRFEIVATVGGTLVQPRVTLSTQEQGIGEEDLVSYVMFGRPDVTQLAGTPGQVGLEAMGQVTTLLASTLGTQLASGLSSGLGVDYVSINPQQIHIGTEGSSNPLLGTEVEVGQYLSDDVFIVLLIRKGASSTDGGSSSMLGGAARVEVALTERVTAEAFLEDRFLRTGGMGLGDIGAQASRILGVFVFREWGY